MRKKLGYIIKLALTCTVVLGVVLGSLGLSAQSVSAATSAGDLLKKTLLNGLRTCTSSTYMKNEVTPADYTGIGSIMTSEGNADGTILVPTKVGNSLSDGDVSCKELFLGYSGFLGAGGEISGLLDLYGKSDDDITNFGYTIGESSAGGSRQGCVSYNYSYPDNGRQSTATTNEVCFEVDADNKVVIQDGSDVKWSEASSPVGLSYDSYNGCLLLSMDGTSAATQIVSGIQYGTNMSWDELVSKFENDGGAISTATDTLSHNLGYEFEGANTDLDGGESYSTATKQGNSRLDIMHYLTGDSSFDDLDAKFTENDKYSLYTEYFNAAKNDYDTLTVASECSASKDAASGETGYAIRLGDEWCAVYGVDDVDASYNIVNDTNDGLRNVSFAEMLKAMMDLNYDEIDDVNEETDVGLSGTDTSGSGGEEADPCYSNSGALGWIFCPIITGLGDFLKDVYTTIIENFLAIDPQLLSMVGSTGSQNGTYTAWNIFRNIANVILIIMLLVVVLSQLTGFGISNYGIKKSLPRIVALAIIINVSFVICQLAVDIANIIGYSLNDLLSSIADQVIAGSGITGGANGIQDFLSYFLVGGGALIAAGVAAAFAGWALIIPVLLVLLSGALAVIFLFLLLGVRQAIIVLLVALSPVIVVLFVLPNTQKLAQRGLRMFMMLLAIFPAAGLLVGGGYLASAILMSTSASMDPGAGWLLEIIALALLVVPFFLLPLLIRSGFRAADGVLGMLSARGQGITANLKGRARTGLKDSNLDKTLQTRAANRSINRKGIKVGNHRIGQGAQGRALYHSKKAAESSGLTASWHRMRANRAQNAVVKQGALADRNEKQRTDDAIAAIDRVYADSTTGEMIAVMDNMLASGAANSDSGQRQLAAMMASVSKRQDGGVALTNFLEDNGLGEENKKNLPALKRGLAAGDTMKNLSDTSIRAGTIAGEIASATLDSNGGYKATRDRQAMAAEVASKISSAAPAKLAAQQKDEFKRSIEHITPENAREILRNPDLRSKIAGSTDDPDSSLAQLTVRAGAGASAGSVDSNTAASSAAPRADAASASINLDDVSRETLIVPHGVQGENVAHASQADMEAMARKLRDDQDRRRGRRR